MVRCQRSRSRAGGRRRARPVGGRVVERAARCRVPGSPTASTGSCASNTRSTRAAGLTVPGTTCSTPGRDGVVPGDLRCTGGAGLPRSGDRGSARPWSRRCHTSTPESCHYALWSGSGWLHPGSTRVWSLRPSDGDRGEDQTAPRPNSCESSVGRRDASRARDRRRCPVLPWWGGRNICSSTAVTAVVTLGTPGLPPITPGSDG
jgi:hypothetical protein